MNRYSETTERPLPSLTPDTAWWWEALERGELPIQECEGCGLRRHPPEPACPACGSFEWHPHEVSRRATLHSWVVVHEPALPGFDPPYAVALADLEEGVRMGVELDLEPEREIAIGIELELGVRVRGGIAVPFARPA